MTETLVVTSRVKKLITQKSGFNTSASVATKLTTHIEQIVTKATELAKADGRKTVMDRDVTDALTEMGITQ